MGFPLRSLGRLIAALSLPVLLSLGACAGGPPQAQKMPVSYVVRAPSGYVDFCQREPDACRADSRFATPVSLTEARWRELNDINLAVNRAIKPVTDQVLVHKVEYWQYPDKLGAGDCEDYALLKRRELVRRGWPAGSLLIATARNERNELHAVLMVTTDHGDFVLDNARNFVEAWNDLPYLWVAREDPTSPLTWHRAIAPAADIATAALADASR